MTYASLWANQHARNFGLFSYTVVCISAFYYIFIGWKQPILILAIEKYIIGQIQFRGKTLVSLKILKMVQQPSHCNTTESSRRLKLRKLIKTCD